MLRAATTDSSGDESQSYVTVLATRSGRLEKVGQVGGLGKGERIYAVRFIGERGYVVTFRQIDPLYTLDLADPARRRPWSASSRSSATPPTCTRSATGCCSASARTRRARGREGTQLSLFDVSDPAAPRLLQRQTLAVHVSDVEYDHHAFLWWAPKRLAVVPVTDYDERAARAGVRVPRRPRRRHQRGGLDLRGRRRPAHLRDRRAPLHADRRRACTRTTSTRSPAARSPPSRWADRKFRAGARCSRHDPPSQTSSRAGRGLRRARAVSRPVNGHRRRLNAAGGRVSRRSPRSPSGRASSAPAR